MGSVYYSDRIYDFRIHRLLYRLVNLNIFAGIDIGAIDETGGHFSTL